MTDRRSETSRANLGEHIPEAVAPEGSEVVSVRLPKSVLADLDQLMLKYRPGITRSEYLRELIGTSVQIGKALDGNT